MPEINSTLATLGGLAKGGLALVRVFTQKPDAAGDVLRRITQPAGVAARIEMLLARPALKKRLRASLTAIDLIGIAWEEALASTDDSQVVQAFGMTSDDVRRCLGCGWFVDVVVAADTADTWPNDDDPLVVAQGLSGTVQHLIVAACDELPSDTEPNVEFVESLFSEILTSLPARIDEIVREIPELRARLNDLLARRTAAGVAEIRAYVTGEQWDEAAAVELERIASDLVAEANRDCFRRPPEECTATGLPFLALQDTYVEPSVCQRGSRVEAGAMAMIRDGLTQDPSFVSLLAPFGNGKSLTCRMFASRLAEEWLSNRDGEFPLLLHCPDLLATQSRCDVEAAVIGHLRDRFGVAREVANRIWDTVKLVLIFDSFDEVVQPVRDAEAWVEGMRRVASRPSIAVVLASRPFAVEARWLGKDDWVLEVNPFDSVRRSQWLTNTRGVLHDGDFQREAVERLSSDLLGTPILLLIATWVVGRREGSAPGTRTELYGDFFEILATGKWSEVQRPHPVIERGSETLDAATGGADAFKEALCLVAWCARTAGSDGLPLRTVSDLLRRSFERRGGGELRDTEVDQVAKSLVLSLLIRRADGRDAIQFTHRSFRDFLSAKYLAFQVLAESGETTFHPGNLALAEWHVEFVSAEERAFAAELLDLALADEGRRSRIAARLRGWAEERRVLVIDTGQGVEQRPSNGRTVYALERDLTSGARGAGYLLAVLNGVPNERAELFLRARPAVNGWPWFVVLHRLGIQNNRGAVNVETGQLGVWCRVNDDLRSTDAEVVAEIGDFGILVLEADSCVIDGEDGFFWGDNGVRTQPTADEWRNLAATLGESRAPRSAFAVWLPGGRWWIGAAAPGNPYWPIPIQAEAVYSYASALRRSCLRGFAHPGADLRLNELQQRVVRFMFVPLSIYADLGEAPPIEVRESIVEVMSRILNSQVAGELGSTQDP